ncbi:hypothetical protein Patl1_11188 [Pistacia atlantica]|uniref:Uncharacterized protein n=1 Tax=Pistacia atlantica TaxID=434234 RepID=A0ACC1A6K6_9ROSI|nr:hypothetical protein Patl1_11188 [Pistacia atlantica]
MRKKIEKINGKCRYSLCFVLIAEKMNSSLGHQLGIFFLVFALFSTFFRK